MAGCRTQRQAPRQGGTSCSAALTPTATTAARGKAANSNRSGARGPVLRRSACDSSAVGTVVRDASATRSTSPPLRDIQRVQRSPNQRGRRLSKRTGLSRSTARCVNQPGNGAVQHVPLAGEGQPVCRMPCQPAASPQRMNSASQSKCCCSRRSWHPPIRPWEIFRTRRPRGLKSPGHPGKRSDQRPGRFLGNPW